MEYDLTLIKDLVIAGTPAVPIIIGLVALLKKFSWFNSEWAPYAAGGFSVLAYGAVKFLDTYPQYMTIAEPIAFSVYLFLAVSLTYQLAKTSKVIS